MKIIIKTKKLTDSSVLSNAFKGISKKATFTCPKGKVNAYKKILRKKGASKKQTMMLALFVEELCNNIIKFGFTDKKKHSIDVRAIKLDDGWKLRIRDDCKRFDPTEWIKIHESDDPTQNIGIRMVCGMAKNVSYLSTMELNNISIKI